MEIVVSGLAETVGLEAARKAVGPLPQLRWVEPDLLFEGEGSGNGPSGVLDIVWTYQLPWRHPAAASVEPESFRRWLSANRRALNLRREPGARLTFVDTAACGERCAYDMVLTRIVTLAIPEIGDVLSMLDASSRSDAAVQDWAHVRDGDALLTELCRMLAAERVLREEQANRNEYERQLAELFGKNRLLAASESDLMREAGALKQELRETHVALEQHFIEVQKLRAEAAGERSCRLTTEATNQSLRRTLEGVQTSWAQERAKAEQALAATEALAGERARRTSLERERDVLLMRVEALSALAARTQQRMEDLQSGSRATAAGWVPAKVRGVGRRLLRRRSPQNAEIQQIRRIAESEWFDANWYLDSYPDVKAAGMAPVAHYLMHGWKEGRNPGPDFDTVFYLGEYADVKESGMNPLWHFVEFGQAEGRSPRSARNG